MASVTNNIIAPRLASPPQEEVSQEMMPRADHDDYPHKTSSSSSDEALMIMKIIDAHSNISNNNKEDDMTSNFITKNLLISSDNRANKDVTLEISNPRGVNMLNLLITNRNKDVIKYKLVVGNEDAERRADAAEACVIDQEQTIDEKNKEIAALMQTAEIDAKDNEDVKRHVSTAEARIVDQDQTIDANNKEIETLKQTTENDAKKIKDVESRAHTAEARIVDQDQTIDAKNKEIETLKQTIENDAKKIKDVESRVATAEARVEDQKQTIDAKDGEIASLSHAVSVVATWRSSVADFVTNFPDIPQMIQQHSVMEDQKEKSKKKPEEANDAEEEAKEYSPNKKQKFDFDSV